MSKLTGRAKAAFVARMAAGRKLAVRKARAPSRSRRNSSEELAAAELYEAFHGKKSSRVTVYDEPDEVPEHVAELGRLIELLVIVDPAENNYITEIDGFGDCRLVCTPDGGQLYFIGGKQSLDLHSMGLEHQLPKDHVEIGQLAQIKYHTKKGFHDFEPTDYYHNLGEDNGRMPTLHYDARNKRLFLSGGTYQVRPEGIVN